MQERRMDTLGTVFSARNASTWPSGHSKRDNDMSFDAALRLIFACTPTHLVCTLICHHSRAHHGSRMARVERVPQFAARYQCNANPTT